MIMFQNQNKFSDWEHFHDPILDKGYSASCRRVYTCDFQYHRWLESLKSHSYRVKQIEMSFALEPSSARSKKGLDLKMFLIWDVPIEFTFSSQCIFRLFDKKRHGYFSNRQIDQGCIIRIWKYFSLLQHLGMYVIFASYGSDTTCIPDALYLMPSASRSACASWQCFIH